MNHVLSTHLFVNHRLTSALLTRIQALGIPAVEIFCARQHLDYRDKAQIAELGHWFRDSDLKLNSLHSPMYNDEIWGRSGPHAVITITEEVKSKRLPMVDEIKRALEIAETIPFKYLIQHIGVGGEEFDLRKFDAAFSAIEELSLFARQRGVEILLENIPNELSSAARLQQFQELTHVGLNYCFDTGHANLSKGVEAEFQLMSVGHDVRVGQYVAVLRENHSRAGTGWSLPRAASDAHDRGTDLVRDVDHRSRISVERLLFGRRGGVVRRCRKRRGPLRQALGQVQYACDAGHAVQSAHGSPRVQSALVRHAAPAAARAQSAGVCQKPRAWQIPLAPRPTGRTCDAGTPGHRRSA